MQIPAIEAVLHIVLRGVPAVEAVIEAVDKNVKDINGVPWLQQMQGNNPLKYYKNASSPVANQS